jgi:hypothetical protein
MANRAENAKIDIERGIATTHSLHYTPPRSAIETNWPATGKSPNSYVFSTCSLPPRRFAVSVLINFNDFIGNSLSG